VVAGTICEVARLASVRSVGEGSASHFVGDHDRVSCGLVSVRLFVVGSKCYCGGGHDSCWRCARLWSLGLRGLSLQLWWRKHQVRTLLWPLFARSAWDQPATVLGSTIVEGAFLASIQYVGVGSASHCVGEHDR
jgi:hypothetical protein